MTAPNPKTLPAQQGDKRMFIASVLFFVVTLGVVIAANTRTPPTTFPPTRTPAQVITLEPQVVINLTVLPQATAPSGELGEQLAEIEILFAACDAYNEQRRQQMRQHLAWLKVPASIPSDLVPAFGANLTGKLVFGMATYTYIEWTQRGRPAESCLVTIGQVLNKMVVSLGETPYPEFNTIQQGNR